MISSHVIIISTPNTVYGNTPGHYASEGGHPQCFNCWLQHDGDLQAANVKQDTPLDTAKKNGHPLQMEKACTFQILYNCIYYVLGIFCTRF